MIGRVVEPDLLVEFERIYADWRAAMSRRDRTFLERMEHDDFRYTGTDGTIKYKDDHLDQITSAVRGEFDTTLDCVRQYGSVVVVAGRHFAKVETDDSSGLSEAVRDRMRQGMRVAFTTVWLDSPHGWQAVAHHTSEITA